MNILVVDTETGGLSADKVDILTIGIVPIINGELLADKGKTFYVKGERVEKKAMEINKIDLKAHNKVALSRKEVFKQLREYIESTFPDGYIVVGHNIAFDLRFLAQVDPENKLFNERNVIDTKQFALTLKTLGFFAPDQSTSLQSLINTVGIVMEGGDAHEALPDAIATAKLFILMSSRILYMYQGLLQYESIVQSFDAVMQSQQNPDPDLTDEDLKLSLN